VLAATSAVTPTAEHQETEPTMNRTKPLTPEDAIAIVEKRRRQARSYYARVRDDARRYREALKEGKGGQTADVRPSGAGETNTGGEER